MTRTRQHSALRLAAGLAVCVCLAAAPARGQLSAPAVAEKPTDPAATETEADPSSASEAPPTQVKPAEAQAAEAQAAEAKSAEAQPAGAKPVEAQTSPPQAGKPRLEKARYAMIDLAGSLAESPGAAGLLGELQNDLRKTVARIDQAAKDSTIRGLVLRLREPALGRGQVHELRQAIARFRAAGKHAVAEFEVADNNGYIAAIACDEVVMPESGFVVLTGVRAEPLFYKGLLAKAGLRADFEHVGDAKGAAEPYTRRSWSEPVKENITSLVDDLYQQMVDTIAMDRPVTRAAAVAAIDRGLLTAAQAKQAGLVDRVAYSDDLRGALADRENAKRLVFVENYGKRKVDTDFSGPGGFFKLLGMMAGGSGSASRSGDKVAIVYAVGPIVTGKSEVDPFGGVESVGSTTIVEALDEASRDKRTRAIVLRVDSPGGSAVASDLIWRKIRSIEKPVVASMGDVAASGGYYISMGADRVFAEPSTVTGSIGVVGGKLAMRGLLDKIGVTSDLVSRGANSGLFSSLDRFTDQERAALVGLMEDTYEQFTAKAAEGRGLAQSRVKELGGGRVYTGRQAKDLGLVDELGDLRVAVAEAKKLAGLEADSDVRIDTYPAPTDLFEQLFGENREQREVDAATRAAVGEVLSLGGVLPELGDVAARLGVLRRVMAREPVALVMPYDLRID